MELSMLIRLSGHDDTRRIWHMCIKLLPTFDNLHGFLSVVEMQKKRAGTHAVSLGIPGCLDDTSDGLIFAAQSLMHSCSCLKRLVQDPRKSLSLHLVKCPL